MKWIIGSGNLGYWTGTYEPVVQRAFVNGIIPNGIVYDIGAHVGFYTLLAGAKGSRVYSFEPNRDSLRFLERHVAMNGVDASVFPIGLSDKTGIELFGCEGDYNPSTYGIRKDGEPVTCETIDYLVGADLIRPPTLMKIDVEGASRKVVMGAEDTIKIYHPKIIIETAEYEGSLDLLRAWGYMTFEIGHDQWLAIPELLKPAIIAPKSDGDRTITAGGHHYWTNHPKYGFRIRKPL